MTEITMPRLSDSMEEGTILGWTKADGDRVERGDEIAEIESDKATMAFEADAAGYLRIVAAAGQTLPVGATIAHVVAQPGDVPAGDGPAPPAAGEAAPAPAASPAPAPPAAAGARAGAAPRPKASPVARRAAREAGIDLATVAGTGPAGRIVRADVERSAAAGPAASAAAPAGGDGAKGAVSVVELTRTQQVVARRMGETKATVPEFTVSTEVDMEACVALRAALEQLAADEPPPSFNDIVVKACAIALREHPQANGSYRDGRFELYGRVNVGIAVAAQDALVVPTIFDADARSLRDIARTSRTLAARVRAGEVTPPELAGGTFTVSNLGMFGVTHFTAVINSPQAAILAVGAMVPAWTLADGQPARRRRLQLTLTCDHRILYGADAARFLARIRELLENPLAALAV